MKSTVFSAFLISMALTSAVHADNADNPKYIKFEAENLRLGRVIWLGTCENCHAYGIADSPNPLVPKDWEKRLTKDTELLYKHALEGFFGPDDSMMPAKGGNENLTDVEVKAAVDYMIALARHNINIVED